MTLSIVIPVYNAGKYLSKLINSLDAYVSRNDVELIFINDGSTDNSQELLDIFCIGKSNTHIVKTENRGVSSARNLGIHCANGKYIWFVDADDEINADKASYLLTLLKQDFDLIWVKMKTIEESGNVFFSDYKLEQGPHTIYDWRKKFIGQGGMMCQYIVRTRIIKDNHIKFVEWAKWFEDADFLFQISAYSFDIYIEKTDWFYCYRLNSESAMRSTKYEDRLICSLKLSVYAIERSTNYNIEAQEFIKGVSAISIAWCLRCLDSDLSSKMYNYIKKHNILPLKLFGTWRQKLQIFVLNHSFIYYKKLVNLL